jgi:outer membrane protein OmpA-like peptidoglycan-associated protein
MTLRTAPTSKESTAMNRTLIASALLGSLLLGACASTPEPSAALIDARSAVRSAELDRAVLNLAPMELKKATDTLARANQLQVAGGSQNDIDHAAYLAGRQARSAVAIAQAKTSDIAIGEANVERERARADQRSVEADKAKAQAVTAQAGAADARAQADFARAQTGAARERAAAADQRAGVAEQRSQVAMASAADAQSQAAQLRLRLDELSAKATERGQLVTLGDVLFETGRATVKPGAQNSLRKLAGFLQQYPDRRVLIEGHTDNVGSTGSNQALSQRRAEAVDVALLAMGVSAQRMATVGYGEDYPVTDNVTDSNRALNRRVEVYIADNDQPVRPRR